MKVFTLAGSRRARVALAAATALALMVGVGLPRLTAQAAGEVVNVGNASVTEGDSGTTPADVTFTLSQASPNTTTVSYKTVEGTATEPEDYVYQEETVVFNPGETSKHVAFSVRGDTVNESTETFKVTVTDVNNGFAKGTDGTVTITDNDAPPSVSVSDRSQTETSDLGFKDMVFTAHLSSPSGTPVTYYAFTSDPSHDTDPVMGGTQLLSPKANGGTDYTQHIGTNGIPVNFAAGVQDADIAIPIKGDLTDEFDEYFEVQLKATNTFSATTVAYANGKIIDDDALARLDVSDPAPKDEGDVVCGTIGNPCTGTHITFTVTLSPASEKRVVVDYATSDRSATASNDYVTKTGSGDPNDVGGGDGLVFNPGVTSMDVDVFIKGDTIAEPNERFALTLSNPKFAALGDGQAFGTILNDDQGGNFATVSVANATPNPVPEASGTPKQPGTATFVITVNRTGITDLATYNVSYTTADGPESPTSTCGKAVAGSDYTATSDTASIPPGQSTAMVTVDLLNDTADESDECFQLQLNDATNANITDAVGEATISDDDPPPSLAIADKAITEGTGTEDTTASLTVTLTPAAGKRITVDCTTTEGSGTASDDDYVATSTPVVFEPGDTSKTCDVPVVADSTDENNETLTVALSNPTPSGSALIGDGTATLTINDDDNPPTVSVGNFTDTEGTGDDSVASFPVALSAPSGKTITVHLATADGTAKQPGDYTTTTADITFNPGEKDKLFPVPVKGDSIDEGNETFTATVTNPAASPVGIGTSTGTTTIQDDDDPATLSINDVTVAEGNNPAATTNANFTVTLAGATEQTVTVHYATGTTGTATSSVDYMAVTGDLNFAPGETTKTVAVPVKGDTLDESDETFNVVLSAPTNATISDASGTGTITDDDSPVPSLTINDASGAEGGKVTFTVTASGTSAQDMTVKVSTTGDTATQGTDYTGLTDQTVTIPAGQTSKTFDVQTTQDTTDEPSETFTATLSAPTNATLGSPSSGTGTIVDDDNAPTVTINNATATEGDNETFTITLSASTNQDVTVTVNTANGSAGAGDYTPLVNQTVTIPAGDTSKTFNVATTEDTAHESTETFTATLSNALGATLGSPSSGTGTINDDDAAATKAQITTGAGPGGGPHIQSFVTNSPNAVTAFMDGAETTGKRVARGDLDGDGVDEIITGSGPNSAAVVSVYSATGQLKASSFAYAGGRFYGGVFVAAGDIDGDGKAEVITGAGPGGGPHVIVWKLSGSDLTPVDGGFFAYSADWHGGVTVAAGDTTGDGKDEIITGPGAGGGPDVEVTTGTKGEGRTRLLGFMAYVTPDNKPNWNGGVNVAAGDVDGDGKAEIAVVPWNGGGPHLRLFNPDATLHNNNGGIFVGPSNFPGGLTVGMGDLSGDGKAEIVVGVWTGSNRIKAYTGDLQPIPSLDFAPYGEFKGGNFVAVGQA